MDVYVMEEAQEDGGMWVAGVFTSLEAAVNAVRELPRLADWKVLLKPEGDGYWSVQAFDPAHPRWFMPDQRYVHHHGKTEREMVPNEDWGLHLFALDAL